MGFDGFWIKAVPIAFVMAQVVCDPTAEQGLALNDLRGFGHPLPGFSPGRQHRSGRSESRRSHRSSDWHLCVSTAGSV